MFSVLKFQIIVLCNNKYRQYLTVDKVLIIVQLHILNLYFLLILKKLLKFCIKSQMSLIINYTHTGKTKGKVITNKNKIRKD